jgi:hypothetical protein
LRGVSNEEAAAEFLVQGRCTPQYLKDEDNGYKKQIVGVTIEDPKRLTKWLYTLGLCLAHLRQGSYKPFLVTP